MNFFSAILNLPFLKNLFTKYFCISNKALQRNFCGLTFKNPVGLAAGFDKNARYLTALSVMGFGSVEIGTVTPLPQSGNIKPRLFRLPKDKALINRMGFNNDGAEKVADRLSKWRMLKENKNTDLIIGGNIGKNKQTKNEDAFVDYEKCFRILHPHVDYFVVNVSSPNTPGLRELQEKESLKKILTNLLIQNKGYLIKKPIFLKLAPDLTETQLDEIIALCTEIELDGLIIANTTINRSNLKITTNALEQIGAGGLSGKPLASRSTYLVDYIYRKSNGALKIIASGGIFNAADAREKIDAGASLVQVWTGFVYEGPAIVNQICKGL